MGSPVSAVVANLYLEFFEELALRTAPARPRIWKRYVDDTFTLVKQGDLDELLVHLNSIRPSIKLTTELEEGGSIPFLDTRVTRKVDGKLDVTVYRKPTHTERYLHFSSHHPTHVKKGLVRCLYDCARNITKEASNLESGASHTMELVMKEALCIQSTPADSRFNRDGGYELPDCWFALNRKLRGGAIVGHRAPLTGRMRSTT